MTKKMKKRNKILIYDQTVKVGMTEEEQFKKALCKCRNCGHIKMAHSFLINKKGKCIDASLSAQGKYVTCTCKGWQSSNNLEYLEEVYEKKKNSK